MSVLVRWAPRSVNPTYTRLGQMLGLGRLTQMVGLNLASGLTSANIGYWVLVFFLFLNQSGIVNTNRDSVG